MERATAVSGRGDRRRASIIDAAIAVFMEAGYAGASIDRIVQVAGGSKATLYRHFPSKAELFAAIIQTLVQRMFVPIDRGPIDETHGLAAALTRFGENYLEVLLEPRGLALYRMVMGESTRFPHLGSVFFEQGPGRVAQWLADYLRGCGWEATDAAAQSRAWEFLSLVRADLHLRALLGVGIADAEQRAAAVARAVAVFLSQPPGVARG